MSAAPILITGGAGFIGCNIADRLASAGHPVRIYDALLRPGVKANLAWLKERHGALIEEVVADVRDRNAVTRAVRDTDAIFHMAAQVAVTTSLTDPRDDFAVNVEGTLNLLEAVRQCGRRIPLIFASTNKVYGNLADLRLTRTENGYLPVDRAIRDSGIDESHPLDFHTPYGCSKGAADQYVLDYARSFGLPTAALRMSCIYGPRQMGTEDQGWVAHFLIRAMEGRPITIYGDGHQVRDVLYIANAVEAYLAAWRNIDRIAGHAFNLGGGPANAISLLTLLDFIAKLLGTQLDCRWEGWREGDQRYFVADAHTARTELDLRYPLPWREGVARLAQWLAMERPSIAARPMGCASSPTPHAVAAG